MERKMYACRATYKPGMANRERDQYQVTIRFSEKSSHELLNRIRFIEKNPMDPGISNHNHQIFHAWLFGAVDYSANARRSLYEIHQEFSVAELHQYVYAYALKVSFSCVATPQDTVDHQPDCSVPADPALNYTVLLPAEAQNSIDAELRRVGQCFSGA